MTHFPKKVLVIGATSGIGREFASRFVSEGSKVVVVGRRQHRLDEFLEKHGSDKASAVVFDTLKIEEIPSFAKE
jgi:NADP-dependent 3-hydroxy acid dehydrogenase YdfG